MTLGLVSEVVPRDQLEDAVMAQAERWAANSLLELRMLKQSINLAQDAMGYRIAVHAAHSNYMIRELAIPENERAKMGEARQMTRVGAALAKAGEKPKIRQRH